MNMNDSALSDLMERSVRDTLPAPPPIIDPHDEFIARQVVRFGDNYAVIALARGVAMNGIELCLQAGLTHDQVRELVENTLLNGYEIAY